MSWADVEPEIRAAAERVCTEKQLEALRFKAAGYSAGRAARIVGVSRQAMVARLEAARLKLEREFGR